MKKLNASINTPGRMTALAMLVAGLAQAGFASAAAVVPVPNHLVISQVYGGGGNGSGATAATYNHDFVEIFNPTGDTVSLANWTVQYGSATSASAWSGKAALSGSIGPGKYLLVQLASSTAGVDLPTPDVSNTGVNMSATTGKVALVKSTVTMSGATPVSADLVDWIGFGGANGAEGGALAPAPSGNSVNTTAMFRAGGGCVDTDNNANDFTVAPVAPRNSSTPALSCTGAPPVAAIIPSCPPNFALASGSAGSVPLSATDADSVVNNAVISSGATAGISVTNFVASSANGVAATASLSVASSVAAGTYPIGITFSNNGAQTASCTVSVQVQGLAGITHTIPQIQGSTGTSPFNNTVQTTEGVVTFMNAGVYVIQDQNGDNDASTSDALMIFNAPPAGLAVGDLVRVTGTITEFQPDPAQPSLTEMKTVTAALVQSHGNVIQPTSIHFSDAQNPLRPYQSMLVNILDTLTVNQSASLATFGELSLAIGRKEAPTSHYRPGTPEAIQLENDNAANNIVLDDGLSSAPTTVPYIGQDTTVRAGDSVTGLTGILDFGSIGTNLYGLKLQPTVVPTFSRSNPRSDAPVLLAGNVKVAAANVLNFFTVFTNGSDVNGASGKGCFLGSSGTSAGNCRGADNLTEFVRQRDKVVNELKGINADVFGLMEIQNDGDTTVKYLVDQLNAAIGSVTYAVVPKPADTGTDAIRVAMIYKPSVLTLVGGSLSDGNTVNNRPPFAQTFSVANGGKFSLIVNHMKAKSGCSGSSAAGDKDAGDGQSCWNLTRVNQATRLNSFFIPQVVANGGTPNVLVVGDLNSYGMEDPIKVLTDGGLVNQLERFVRPAGMPYSYVFNSEAGYLDHALASAALNPQVLGAAEWHNNADEPTAIDYNFDDKPGGASNGTSVDPSKDLYVNNAYRASDHDPVVISLNLAAPVTDLSSQFAVSRSGLSVNRITGKNTGSITFTNTSGTAISGPFQVQFDGLTAGITLDGPSGTHNGAPYVTVSAGTIAPGATFTLPVVFSNPSRLNVSYTNAIFSGNF